MAGKFPDRGGFDIPQELVDEYQWLADSLLDDTNVSQPCKLVYQPISSECPNCYLDPSTGRSSGVYKSGGPEPFQNLTTCPYCAGEGTSEVASSEEIRLRVYWRMADWIKIGIPVDVPQATVQVIGYMTDLPKLERAVEIVVVNDMAGYREWKCKRKGEAVPHGIGQDRYFIQFLERIGGG